MNQPDLLAILDQIPTRLEDALSSAQDHPTRSPRLARLLRELCPTASLSACLLRQGELSHIGAFDENQSVPADWLERLQSAPSAWPVLLNGEGHSALVEDLKVSGRTYGLVGLRLAHGPKSMEVVSATAILRLFARNLAPALLVEALDRECQELQEELREQERLANSGELAGAVSHEFTNFLNLLLLQVSMLEYQLPPQDHADLAEIRRQGNAAAEVVRRFQEYRQGQPAGSRLVNLNALLTGVADELTSDPPAPLSPGTAELDDSGEVQVTLQLVLTRDLPSVRGTRPGLQRLARFLVSNAMRAAGAQGTVCIRTTVRKDAIRLEVEDSGAQVREEELPHLFDPGLSRREGVEGLELAACRSLVRRLRGSLHAENRSEGGIRIVVDLPGERA